MYLTIDKSWAITSSSAKAAAAWRMSTEKKVYNN